LIHVFRLLTDRRSSAPSYELPLDDLFVKPATGRGGKVRSGGIIAGARRYRGPAG